MKYKVGDKVRIKSIDWYNENKNSDDNYDVVFADGWHFSKPMSNFCSKELIIEKISHAINPPYYIMEDHIFAWTDEMIEGLVEEDKGIDKLMDLIEYHGLKHEFNLPDDYIFKDENGNVINATKIVLEKKKKEYPKTYEEFASLVKRMRKAQKDVIYKSIFSALDSARPTAYEVAKTKQITLESEVDEYLKKIEI